MSFFPTKILVATEGSEEAELAATAAAELAKSTNSELHIVHVSELGAEVSLNPAYSVSRDLTGRTVLRARAARPPLAQRTSEEDRGSRGNRR